MAVSEIRQATVKRKTSETDIALFLRIDGSGEAEVDTGIGFFDHMLKSVAKHGLFDLKLKVTGDLIVDCHHTIEDVGIVLGVMCFCIPQRNLRYPSNFIYQRCR